ncbi:hypothetical protein [Methylobacterium oxalidis]|nr:hypothetical protein [Methylobacterium oxalidis]
MGHVAQIAATVVEPVAVLMVDLQLPSPADDQVVHEYPPLADPGLGVERQ